MPQSPLPARAPVLAAPCARRRFLLLSVGGSLALMARAQLATAASAPPNPAASTERAVDRLQRDASGFYLLWAENRPEEEALLRLPFIRGGQVVGQWQELEPHPGAYDFRALDAKLARYARLGKWATVQINGNLKPAWLFDVVPSVRERLSVQVQDRRGSLLFWHPRFQEAHLALIAAVGRHLRTSAAAGGRLLGVRLNFNALGTEHLEVPPSFQDPRAWTWPPGAATPAAAALPRYSETVRADYSRRVVDAYLRAFADWTVVFLRNNFDLALVPGLEADLRAGRLGLFHTSSEAEPRAAGVERQYGRFLDFARPGHTVAYAEPWASAWGEHGGQTDPRWCSAAQWNYWTLLLNLHCGVSFIGEYYANLQFAHTGRHGRARPGDDPAEFLAAYTWAADYLGRHRRPADAPGAWVALRANAVAKADNPKVGPANRRLARLTGDYDFLLHRVEAGDTSTGVGPVGPPAQRFGAFARRYPAGGTARFRLDPAFRRSLRGAGRLRIIYLDTEAAPAAAHGAPPASAPAPVPAAAAPRGALGTVAIGAQTLGSLPARGTGRWLIAEFPVPAAAWPDATAPAPIAIQAGPAAPLTLHLIEVRRDA